MKNLSQKEWKEAVEKDNNAVLVDVRTPVECCSGTIKKAINIDVSDYNNFVSEIKKFDKTKNYYLYCVAGGRSQMACQIMTELGFENTFNLIGGISCWEDEIMKTQ